jgi:hypothetical protein
MKEDYMEKQFVTYEIALAVKELGFARGLNQYPCFGFYNPQGKHYYGFSGQKGDTYSNFTNKGKTKVILSPLWQQVIDWFNKEYDIKFSFPYWSNSDKLPECMRGKYDCAIFVADGKAIPVKNKMDSYYFDEPYEMREQSILKAIELCKKEK